VNNDRLEPLIIQIPYWEVEVGRRLRGPDRQDMLTDGEADPSSSVRICRVKRGAVMLAAVGCLVAGAGIAGAEVVRVLPTRAVGDAVDVSANGRFVVAEDQEGGCGHGRQIVLFDRQTSQVECVSVGSDGFVGDDSSFTPSISADGQLIAFRSRATNLTPSCTPALFGDRIFIRNRRTHRTSCVTLAPSVPDVTFYKDPIISADGRLLVINAVSPTELAAVWEVFAIQLEAGEPSGAVERVSAGPSWSTPDGSSQYAVVSADGRFVAFQSEASNLVPNDPNARGADIFVRDRASMRTTCLTCEGAGTGYFPSISADGRFIVFSRLNSVYRVDLVTGEAVSVCPALQRLPRQAGETPRASISADGRFVLFVSGVTDLVAGDDNGAADLFAADLSAPATIQYTRVNLATDGVTQANADVRDFPKPVAMSADARVIAFISAARNLAPADAIGRSPSLFLARMPGRAGQIVTGAGGGGGPHVRMVDLAGVSAAAGDFFAYRSDFTGGASVAYGDLDGDGAADIVTGAGPGGGPHVRAFSAARYDSVAAVPHELAGFMAYDSAFRGGVSVAVGDVTGDGIPEIITAAGAGGIPHVRVFALRSRPDAWGRMDVYEYTGFLPYAAGFTGGVRVAVGDVDGDGVNEIITGAGPGGGADVEVFKLDGVRVMPVLSLLAYDTAFRGGVFVAAGDVDGDGRDDLITGADAGGGPHVRVFSVARGFTRVSELAGFMAYDPAFRGGVRVAGGDVDGDGRADIITGAGPGGGPHVLAVHRAADGTLSLAASFFAYTTNHTGGVFVAAAPH